MATSVKPDNIYETVSMLCVVTCVLSCGNRVGLVPFYSWRQRKQLDVSAANSAVHGVFIESCKFYCSHKAISHRNQHILKHLPLNFAQI